MDTIIDTYATTVRDVRYLSALWPTKTPENGRAELLSSLEKVLGQPDIEVSADYIANGRRAVVHIPAQVTQHHRYKDVVRLLTEYWMNTALTPVVSQEPVTQFEAQLLRKAIADTFQNIEGDNV